MRKMILVLTIISIPCLSSLITGCAAGQMAYQPPSQHAQTNIKTIDKPLDEVWKNAVSNLGKQFFVINNIDKSSGLINVSYNGSPEKYIDCGQLSSHVENLRGTRDYNFSGSKEYQEYEVMTNGIGGELWLVKRKMSLEGRINLIFEATTKNQTRITANTRYVVIKDIQLFSPGRSIAGMNGSTVNFHDSISFNSGNEAVKFTGNSPTECKATGALEKEILELIN